MGAEDGRIDAEQDGDASHPQVAPRDLVPVDEVADLDLEVQVVVVLVSERGEAARLYGLVRGARVAEIVAVSGKQGARAAKERDRSFALLGNAGGRGGSGEEDCEAKSHCVRIPEFRGTSIFRSRPWPEHPRPASTSSPSRNGSRSCSKAFRSPTT